MAKLEILRKKVLYAPLFNAYALAVTLKVTIKLVAFFLCLYTCIEKTNTNNYTIKIINTKHL